MKTDTDREWEKWGKKDPYYGVITVEKFRRENFDEAARQEFFDSGRDHIAGVYRNCKKFLDPEFSPSSALDFGCGTGRLLIPLAQRFGTATGIDVSDSMLSEARRNCERYSIDNVELLKSDDLLTAVKGEFDLIHSFIVFQHIPVDRGRRLFRQLLNHLADGGICALHLTYGKMLHAENFGCPPREERGFLRGVAGRIKAATIGALRYVFTKDKNREGSVDPEMQMNPYNLNELLFIIQSLGVTNLYVELTDHTGDLGVYLYFQKPAAS